MDGYKKQVDYLKKFLDLQMLFDNQVNINNEINDISKEIVSLPEIPESLENWAESLADVDEEGFKLSDFKKIFKINKEYNNLIERRNENAQKIKLLVIDNLIDRIKDILDK